MRLLAGTVVLQLSEQHPRYGYVYKWIYTTTNLPQYFSGLLIAVEVIPITIVAAVTKTTDSETSYGTTTSPNTSGTKGAKMSTIKNSALSVRSDRMDDTSKTTTADVPGARDPVASAATDNSKEIQTGDTNDEDSDNDMYPSSADPESSTSESEASKSEAGEQKNEEDSEQESASQASEPSKKELNWRFV